MVICVQICWPPLLTSAQLSVASEQGNLVHAVLDPGNVTSLMQSAAGYMGAPTQMGPLDLYLCPYRP